MSTRQVRCRRSGKAVGASSCSGDGWYYCPSCTRYVVVKKRTERDDKWPYTERVRRTIPEHYEIWEIPG
jgi:uncharacterized Zn finger protein (UPF0148 family)